MSATHDASDAKRIRDQARVVTKDVQGVGGAVPDVARETVGDLRDGAVEYFEQARGKARKAGRAVGGFTKRRLHRTFRYM